MGTRNENCRRVRGLCDTKNIQPRMNTDGHEFSSFSAQSANISGSKQTILNEVKNLLFIIKLEKERPFTSFRVTFLDAVPVIVKSFN